jgi:restriction system protein
MFGIIKKLISNDKAPTKKQTNKPNTKKSNYKKMIKENIKKGKEYEKYIGNLFEQKGYIVKFNGIEQGKKDSSIDLIAIKGNQIIFTQCKNWKENSKYKINHEKIKAFIGDSYSFIEKNQQYKNYNIKRLFCLANDVFDKSAKNYLEQNKSIIEYRIIKPELAKI